LTSFSFGRGFLVGSYSSDSMLLMTSPRLMPFTVGSLTTGEAVEGISYSSRVLAGASNCAATCCC
jgi:hypothetical protein